MRKVARLVRRALSRRLFGVAALGLAILGLTVALGVTWDALRDARTELAWVRARLAERREQVRAQRDEVHELAARIERVARAASGARERASQLRRVARLEESREPETSPLILPALPDGELLAFSPEGSLAIEQLAWVEGQTAALNESVALLSALLRDGRSSAIGGMPTRWPVRGEISSEFGLRVQAVGGDGSEFHPGVDIRAPLGTPVMASGAGQVSFAGAMSGYGAVVVIDHGQGVSTLYGHLSEIHTEEGRSVRRGEVIGAVGRSGRATGTHLHYELRMGGDPVDPICHLGQQAPPERRVALTTRW